MSTVRRPMVILGALVGAVSMLHGLVGCAPGYDMVRSDPSLYPIFQFGVTDYVNRCSPDDPTDVTVTATDGTTVSVDGQPPRGGTFTTQVDQQVNERFTIVVSSEENTTTHHVRCLPVDFPEWQAARTALPQAEFYATAINPRSGQPNVPVIFDTNGVPVWWTERSFTILFTPLSNDNLATLNLGGEMVERQLDGTVTRQLETEGAPADLHDVILLPNGHYVMATYDPRPCDLSPWGVEEPATCVFHELQELTSTGAVVWNWRPEDDIPITETTNGWRSVRSPSGHADPWHWNSVEWTGDGFIVSFRHLNAIYKIDYASKDVVWKLGGTRRPERLQVIGDPVFDNNKWFGGQHDARLLPGGIVSLFDNGTGMNRAPRSVAYQIDEASKTATLVRLVTEPIAPHSACCGSTRVLDGGNHVTGWGRTPWITENKPDGTQVFRLGANHVYRGIPIEPGRYGRDELRAGMDAQYDNGVISRAAAAPSPTVTESLDDLRFQLGLIDRTD